MYTSFPFQFVTGGVFAVDAFYFLSGFLITIPILKLLSEERPLAHWALVYFHRYVSLPTSPPRPPSLFSVLFLFFVLSIQPNPKQAGCAFHCCLLRWHLQQSPPAPASNTTTFQTKSVFPSPSLALVTYLDSHDHLDGGD